MGLHGMLEFLQKSCIIFRCYSILRCISRSLHSYLCNCYNWMYYVLNAHNGIQFNPTCYDFFHVVDCSVFNSLLWDVFRIFNPLWLLWWSWSSLWFLILYPFGSKYHLFLLLALPIGIGGSQVHARMVREVLQKDYMGNHFNGII